MIGLVLTPETEGQTTLTLQATDDSAEKASSAQTYTISVVDQNRITIRYCLMILAGIILLIILLSILRAATRPRFNGELQVSINSIPQKNYPLNSTLKKASMSLYTPPAHQFTSVMASGLEIRPAKAGIQVVVKNAAKLRGAEVKLGNMKLGAKAKKGLLKKGAGELTATLNGETMSWKLVPKTTTVRPGTRR